MEVSGRRKESDSDDNSTGVLCDPCARVNEKEKAVFYCTVCNEFLCHADAKAHRKNAMSMAHILLDRNSMPRQKIGSYEDNICTIHKGEILKYYCNPHSKSCCSMCATKEHRHCEVEYIDDIAKGYDQSNEYKSLVKDMADLMRRVHIGKQQSVDNKKNAQRIHSEIVSAIRKFREEINSIIDSLENASLKEAKMAIDAENKEAESTTTNCDTFMTNLQEMMSTSENLRKFKQERQLVLHSKKARVQVKEIEERVSQLSELNERKDYKFIPDNEIHQLLRSLKSIGQLEIMEESTKPNQSEQKAKKKIFVAEVLVPVVNQPVTASHVRDINIRYSTDTGNHCFITGGVMIDQSRLVLVDRDNNSVKVVDVISDNVIFCIKPPSGPWDITRVEQDQVVVSCDRGKLVFLKVGKTLSMVKQLDVGADVRGIAYTKNSLLVVFRYPDSCVKVMDLRGKTMKTFKNDAAGNNLFNDPQCIALSEDQNTIIVSDPGNKRVTSLRMNGKVQGVYTDDNLRGPRGLSVDRNDNVYVAGFTSHNIHQLSTECKPIRVILDATHGITYPWMVTYCKAEHKLYVGYASWSRANHISVFQLC